MGDISENLLVQSKSEDGGVRNETKEKQWKVLVTGYGVSVGQLTSFAFSYCQFSNVCFSRLYFKR